MQPRWVESESRADLERRRVLWNADREKGIEASEVMHSVLARYADSEGSTIVRSVTGLDRVRSLGKTPRKLQQKNARNNIQGCDVS